MTMYLAEVNSVPGFYSDEIGAVPDNAVKLTDILYQQLLLANSKGASLAVKNNEAIALDYQGNAVDLSSVTESSSFSKPASLADQAQAAFQKARLAYQDLQMMGKTFGPNAQKYMQELDAIIQGTDTKSTALPAEPSDMTA